MLHWDPMDRGKSHDKLVSPLSTFLEHPGFRTFIRLLPSSCLSMYANQSVLPSTFRGLWQFCLVRCQIVVIHMFFFRQICMPKKSGLTKNYFLQLCQEGAPLLGRTAYLDSNKRKIHKIYIFFSIRSSWGWWWLPVYLKEWGKLSGSEGENC